MDNQSVITPETLREWGACPEAQKLLKQVSPDGATLEQIIKYLTARDQLGWLSWLAARAPGLTLEERRALADESNNPAWWRGDIAAYAPGLTAAERRALADESDNPAYWRGRVAAYTPGLTLEERRALADESDYPAYWRGEIAPRAPGC